MTSQQPCKAVSTLNKVVAKPLRKRALKQIKTGTDPHPRTKNHPLQHGAMPLLLLDSISMVVDSGSNHPGQAP
jgi:hypothetical protein